MAYSSGNSCINSPFVFSFLLDRDRIAIGSEEGLYVIEVTRDGKCNTVLAIFNS